MDEHRRRRQRGRRQRGRRHLLALARALPYAATEKARVVSRRGTELACVSWHKLHNGQAILVTFAAATQNTQRTCRSPITRTHCVLFMPGHAALLAVSPTKHRITASCGRTWKQTTRERTQRRLWPPSCGCAGQLSQGRSRVSMSPSVVRLVGNESLHNSSRL